MSGAVKAYIDRSMNVLKRNTAKVMRMDGTNQPPPLPLLTFSSPPSSSTSASSAITALSSLATGSDADIGGLSTCSLDPIPLSSSSASGPSSSGLSADTQQSHVALHGNLSLAVPPAYAGRIRTGYAAFRTKTRPSLFGEETWDLSLYSHIRMQVAYRGLEAWRGRWYMNIQTDGPVQSDLFQHRLYLPPSPPAPTQPTSPLDAPAPTFHTVHLPLSAFLLTNSGKTSSTQLPMMRERVRTIGISLLGGGRSTEDSPISSTPGSGAGVGSAAGASAFAEAQRLAAGGWKGGKGAQGEVELDSEMEALLRSDLPAGAELPLPRSGAAGQQGAVGGAGGGYHRVGSSAMPESEAPVASAIPQSELAGEQEQEGYYELSIRSVEAVRWDPESEDGPLV